MTVSLRQYYYFRLARHPPRKAIQTNGKLQAMEKLTTLDEQYSQAASIGTLVVSPDLLIAL